MSLDEIHPLVIHFPIALLSTGFLCDLISCVLKNKGLEKAGWWNLVFGTVSSVFALITGLLMDMGSSPGLIDEPFPIYENHAMLQIMVVCAFLALLIWRFQNYNFGNTKTKYIYISLLGIAVAILFYGSHLGAVFSGRF